MYISKCKCKCKSARVNRINARTTQSTDMTWTTHHNTPQHSTRQHSTSWRSATDATLAGHREHTGGSLAGHPRYIRADFGQEAVGGSTLQARAPCTGHTHTSCEQGWRPKAPKQNANVNANAFMYLCIDVFMYLCIYVLMYLCLSKNVKNVRNVISVIKMC